MNNYATKEEIVTIANQVNNINNNLWSLYGQLTAIAETVSDIKDSVPTKNELYDIVDYVNQAIDGVEKSTSAIMSQLPEEIQTRIDAMHAVPTNPASSHSHRHQHPCQDGSSTPLSQASETHQHRERYSHETACPHTPGTSRCTA